MKVIKEKKVNVFNTRMKARLWWASLSNEMIIIT